MSADNLERLQLGCAQPPPERPTFCPSYMCRFPQRSDTTLCPPLAPGSDALVPAVLLDLYPTRPWRQPSSNATIAVKL